MCTAHRGGKLELTPVKGWIPKRSAQSAGEGKGIFPVEKSWLNMEFQPGGAQDFCQDYKGPKSPYQWHSWDGPG